MTLVAGVDSSTQSCKVVIRELGSGTVVRTGRAPHPDGTEVDPQAWWDALLSAIDDAGGLADVAAISIGGQQHGMVVLDAAGEIVRPALLWNDTRSAPAALALIAEAGPGTTGAAVYAERTGSVPVASFTATKLRWLRDSEPENAARVAAVALPHDWLSWRLLGYGPLGDSPLGPDLDALTTDRSDASGTSYWSPRDEGYDLDLFALALGRPSREARGATTPIDAADDHVVLPRVLSPAEPAGVTVDVPSTARPALRGVPSGIVVGPGAGDNAGAALGLGATAGDVIVSIGTSGTVFAVTPEPAHDAAGVVAGFADASGLFLPLVATLNAARVIAGAAKLLGVDLDELGRLAQTAEPGSGGLVLVPYFEGERTPNLPDATASLHGMTLASTSRENLARAAIEGMLGGLAAGFAALRSNGVDARRILLVGGAALNPAVQEVAAQLFDVPVVVPRPGEYVAAGAAVQAAWALTGGRPTWPVEITASPRPDPRPEILERYARYAGR